MSFIGIGKIYSLIQVDLKRSSLGCRQKSMVAVNC